MNKNGSSFLRVALKEVAPAQQVERALSAREVWHLSLEEVEAQTGRVLKREHCPADSLKPSKVWFDTGNVLYSKLRPYLNKVVLPDAPGAATSELIPLRPDPSRLDREFFACYLRSPEFVDFANRNTQGANLPRVSMTEFWKHEVPLPPLAEQRRIVARIQDCLSRVEEMERLQTEVTGDVALLDESIINSMIDGRWPLAALIDEAESIRNGWSAQQDPNGIETGALRLSCVHTRTIDESDVKPVKVAERVREDFAIKESDVFLVRGNGSAHLVGRTAIAARSNPDVIFNDLLIRIRPGRNILPGGVNLVL